MMLVEANVKSVCRVCFVDAVHQGWRAYDYEEEGVCQGCEDIGYVWKVQLDDEYGRKI